MSRYGSHMRSLLEIVAPDRCAACGSSSDGELCEPCAGRVGVIGPDVCARCGDPGNPARASTAPCPCADLGAFRRARSLLVFADPARALTLSIKRRARGDTIRAVGGLLASLARREGLTPPGVVVAHVPAGRSASTRGFDHAGLIARATAAALAVAARRLLVRAREGPRQADVPLDRRRANVAGRFAARYADGPVLLIDDVFTTGATAESCAGALIQAGAASVDVLTWARTLRRRI